MNRLVQTVLISALAGGIAAGAVCTVFLTYEESNTIPEKEAAEQSPLRKHFFHVHPPSVPISAPLVRPSAPPGPVTVTEEKKNTETEKNVTSIVNAAITSDLPSFAPLVRQVIPAVVNISISRDPAYKEKPVKTVTPLAQKVPSPDQKSPAQAPQPRNTKKAPVRSRRAHQKTHHSTHRKIVRPAADDDMTGAGSGFIVDPSGLIVTNRHVVGGATRVTVSLSDGRSLPARLLGDDPMTDIAVIKVDTETPLPCVTWGDSRQVEIGDWILVAGNPFGFGSSVTAGIISAVGRDLGIGAMDDFMQLDAPINPGNSGGPAFNLHGQVIAVNAAIASPSDGSVGIGFGIPAEIVAPVVDQIEKTGHVDHGWLGVTLNDTNVPMVVEDVDQDGPAWEGGLRKKDAILAMGKVQVKDARTVLRSVAAALPGTVFVFTIKRDNEEKTLSITLGKRPASDQ
ncbi:trypsin-like peptidase domain-containing protein [Acetobacteraceae bacterium ESL0709]|nr:trypsin-like peptidase domain-containing protein [Acetobacteraceae bacterium ESL0697]MDF7678805.1 trypsin-like peptidase domain-containing protein [Acetobacteraceae bacterium ESL0709]